MKLEEDLYAYLWQDPYENNCNTYVIRGELTTLIDPGHSRHIERLFQQMEEDGVSPEEIQVVLITHSHPDHFEGLEKFLDRPVKVAMNREEERYLLQSGKLLFEMMGQSLPKFRIDFYLKEGELLLGSKKISYLPNPRSFPRVPCDLLAGQKSPLDRGCPFLWRDRKDRFSRRQFQVIKEKY